MQRFTAVVDHLLFIAGASLLWLAFTVMGLVVFGIGPATWAAADALSARFRGDSPHLWRHMWGTFRASWLSATTRMVPFIAVQIAVALSIPTAMAAIPDASLLSMSSLFPMAMVVLTVVAGLWATASAMCLVAAARVRDQGWATSMRLAALLPATIPLASVLTLLLVAIWSALSMLIPVIGVFAGPAIAGYLTQRIMGPRIAAVLERAYSEASAQRPGSGHGSTNAHNGATTTQNGSSAKPHPTPSHPGRTKL